MIQSIFILIEQDFKYLCDLINFCVVELETMISECKDYWVFGDFIGNLLFMCCLYGVLEKVVMSDVIVLVIGENGMGKEVVVKVICNMGNCQEEVFVVMNCSVLNDQFLESEFFGYVCGAFIGVIRNKEGFFGVVDKGIFFFG